MKCILALDVGTSATKVCLYDLDYKMIFAHSESYQVFYPEVGYAEQNPMDWWEAICKCTNLISEKFSDIDIIAVGIDGQSWSCIPVDKNGDVLHNTPIWLDTRSSEICDRIKAKIGEDSILELCGNSLSPTYSTGKVIWFKENVPEVYSKTHMFLQSNSYIVYKFTNIFSQDTSQGYGYHFYNAQTDSYDKNMADEMGIDINKFPEIYNPWDIVGEITSSASKQTGLKSGIPVIAGALDAAVGTLGAGVVNVLQTQEQGGQAGGMSICIDKYKYHKSLILSRYLIPNTWILQGGTVGGGGTLKWFESQFGYEERIIGGDKNKSSFEILSDMAGKISPTSDGLIFLPYMAGERSPLWDKNAKGVYYGIDYTKTKSHFVRSMMEGVGYSLKHNLEVAKSVGVETDILNAMGGCANSEVWTQIKADITGKEIRVPSTDGATTLGTALLSGFGVGVSKSLSEAAQKSVSITRVHKPNMKNNELYNKCYKTYIELYKRLKGI